MRDEHVVGGSIGDDPAALAKGIARHPGMYMGGPATFERAVAYVRGVEMPVIATGADSPPGDEDRALLMELHDGGRTQEQELAHIRRLECLLARLFSALPKEDA